MFIKHRPYGAFYYYSESVVTFRMILFLKTFILKGSERKEREIPCSSLFADLSVFNVAFTEPSLKKKRRSQPQSTARKSQADRWMTFLTAERQEVRKKGREREKGNKEVKRYRQSHKEQPCNLSVNVLSHQTPIRSSWQESCQSAFHEWSRCRPGSSLHVPV